MKMQNDQPAMPEVLKTRLWMAASIIACVLAAGIFMEYRLGDRFLKLSCLCCICLGIRFFDLFLVIYRRKYEVIEGEVVRIQICSIWKNEWKVMLRDQFGVKKTVYISGESNIRKGMCYRIFLKGEVVLGIEY